MAKSKRARTRKQAKQQRRTEKALRSLEQRLDGIADDRRVLRKQVKKLDKRIDHLTRVLDGPKGGPGRPGPPWGPRGRRGPGPKPPWATGPIVSIEVPLETSDPTAPLWATVSARLPEEISTVEDDGRIARYRYSPAGSTASAPRYRRIRDEGESFSR